MTILFFLKLQEAVVGWDLRTDIHTLWLHDKIAIILLFGLSLVLLIRIFLIWHQIGLVSSNGRKLLEHVLTMFPKGDFSELGRLCQKRFALSPEQGLCDLFSKTESEYTPTLLLEGIRKAHLKFHFRYGLLCDKVEWFHSVFWMALIGGIGIGLLDFILISDIVRDVKAVSWPVVYGAIAENTVLVFLAVIVSGLSKGCYIHFSRRLERRRIYWEYFMGRAEKILLNAQVDGNRSGAD